MNTTRQISTIKHTNWFVLFHPRWAGHSCGDSETNASKTNNYRTNEDIMHN